MKIQILLISLIPFFTACTKDEIPPSDICPEKPIISSRNFKMGFSSWSFGPDLSDIEDTYQFILDNGDIISEQVDDRIPWTAWMNQEALPADFVADIDYRVSKRSLDTELILSVSLLNTDRSDLINDWDGNPIPYTALNDPEIEDAYFAHLQYLIDRLEPEYLVAVMEANELLNKAPSKWLAYKLLMEHIRARLKESYPDLPVSESITLHNFYNPDVTNPTDYIEEISTYVNQLDYAAISFYPFFKGLENVDQFQQAFDFLHSEVDNNIAFVETSHLGEALNIPAYDLEINSDECQQMQYLETLIQNASANNYEFIIWWAHKDFDALWQTFPDEVKDIGQLWRDTGLIDENDNLRSGWEVWVKTFSS